MDKAKHTVCYLLFSPVFFLHYNIHNYFNAIVFGSEMFHFCEWEVLEVNHLDSSLQEECFLNLEAPISRVCGWHTVPHFWTVLHPRQVEVLRCPWKMINYWPRVSLPCALRKLVALTLMSGWPRNSCHQCLFHKRQLPEQVWISEKINDAILCLCLIEAYRVYVLSWFLENRYIHVTTE